MAEYNLKEVVAIIQADQKTTKNELAAAQKVMKDELAAAQKVMKDDLVASQKAADTRAAASQKELKDELKNSKDELKSSFAENLKNNNRKLVPILVGSAVAGVAFYEWLGGEIVHPWKVKLTK